MNLRSQALRGGFYLTIRQGLGVGLSVAGVLLLTRTIGPEQYGIYAAALGIYNYAQNVAQLGLSVYLIRRKEDVSPIVYHQAFTLLLLLGLFSMLLGQVGHPYLEQWVRLDGFGAVCQVLFLGVPFALIKQPAIARMERNLDYKQIAMIEFWNQLFYYLVALPLAFQGWGVWAPVIGWLGQETQSAALFYWKSGYRPRFHWDRHLIKEMLSHSVSFSISSWVWQLRLLVYPMVVGRYAGAAAVGHIALTFRLCETLSFVKRATWRIAIATLARIQDDYPRLLKAVNDGNNLQVLALGPFLVAFAWVGPLLMPIAFGAEWLPVLQVYPFVALGYLLRSMFSMHSSALYALQKNTEVTIFNALQVILLVCISIWLIPRIGIVGYGWAEIATLGSYLYNHVSVVRFIGHPDYRISGLWSAAFGIALFAYQLGYWVAIVLVVVALMPETRRTLVGYLTDFKKARA
jgi:PST family polysaccharide transporter